MAEGEVRYCTTSDGVRIAYWTQGSGPPVFVMPLFIEAQSLGGLLPEYGAFLERLGQGRMLVHYDARGTGLSARLAPDWSQDALNKDVEAIVHALDLTSFSIWASSTSGVRSISYAAHHPEQVDALLLYGTYADFGSTGPTATPEALHSFAELSRANWELASQIFADMTGRKEWPDAALRIGDWYRRSTTGPIAAEVIQNSAASALSLLGSVRCQTLVLHRMDDPTFPFAAAQEIAAGIPDSRFVPLPGNGHAYFLGDSSSVLEAAISFLDGNPKTARALESRTPQVVDGPFRTILFTDLVGHTEMMRRLGDVRGREVLREHERITRDLLKEHSGAEVKTMGDGFMASFASVTKAMDCAIALQRAFAAYTESMPEPLHVRVGLNAGEPIEEDDDLFGSTVIMASRIAARADSGEILIPEPLRHLLTGKSYVYADRGETMLKGFEDAVRLYEVRWRD